MPSLCEPSGLVGEIQGDVGEIRGDAGRYGEIWEMRASRSHEEYSVEVELSSLPA